MRKSRWLSRKFLTALAAELAGIAVLIWPGHEGAILGLAESVTALLVIAGSALGYVRTEGGLDREALRRELAGAGGS